MINTNFVSSPEIRLVNYKTGEVVTGPAELVSSYLKLWPSLGHDMEVSVI